MSDDDESPLIGMDGTIKGDSPTSYSKPDTPEIDKLKSLMVSSPSTNSRTSLQIKILFMKNYRNIMN